MGEKISFFFSEIQEFGYSLETFLKCIKQKQL